MSRQLDYRRMAQSEKQRQAAINTPTWLKVVAHCALMPRQIQRRMSHPRHRGGAAARWRNAAAATPPTQLSPRHRRACASGGRAPPHDLRRSNATQARFSLVVLTFMWLAIGSKEIPNIATNWFVCAVVLGLTQYPVMRAHWKESYARVYDMMGIDPDTGETVSEKKAKKKR